VRAPGLPAGKAGQQILRYFWKFCRPGALTRRFWELFNSLLGISVVLGYDDDVSRVPPAWFLFFFAPLTAEYVSGSSPYLNPFVLLANLLLYGGGTILIRELRVRWGKGWLAVFTLSAAYMVAEEGLMLNTLFDPLKNATGRALGVNWVWTAGMLVVHSLVSICVPILLAEAIYDQRSKESWVKPRVFWWLLLAFAANVFGLGRLIAPNNRPGVIYFLVEAAFIGGCFWLARNMPAPRPVDGDGRIELAPGKLFFGSLAGMVVTMVVNFAAPTLAIPAVVKVVVMLGVYLAFLEWLRRNGVFRPGQLPLSRFAAASGIISFWILVSPLKSLSEGNPGPACFGLLVAVVVVQGWRRLRLARAA
jgi:hypothetical protein